MNKFLRLIVLSAVFSNSVSAINFNDVLKLATDNKTALCVAGIGLSGVALYKFLKSREPVAPAKKVGPPTAPKPKVGPPTAPKPKVKPPVAPRPELKVKQLTQEAPQKVAGNAAIDGAKHRLSLVKFATQQRRKPSIRLIRQNKDK
jgi:hypothetical protein